MTETDQQAQDQQPPNPNVLEEAQVLLVQGKRCMALGDYQAATDALEQAVQLYDAYYGVAQIECADAYLEYGTALVALANLEAGSGTDKIMKKAGIEGEEDGEYDEEEEEGEDDEDGEEGEEGDENGGADEEGEANTTDKPAENGTTKENGQSSSNGHEAPMETSPVKPTSPTPGTSSGNVVGSNDKTTEEEEDNDASNIEIAWEVLSLAKRLFMTDESLEGRLKLTETLQKLGEISIEWDNNDNAVGILEECLNIRKAILPPEDRLIALTYYHLGLAHSFKSETQQANENFQNAVNVIEKRIETLTKELATAKEKQDTAAVSAHEKEINELKELLPDMTMRMDDSKDDGEQTSEVLKRTREEIQQEDEEVKKVCLDKSKPVDDISHLVKRKT